MGAPAEMKVYHHRDHHICYNAGKKGTYVNARWVMIGSLVKLFKAPPFLWRKLKAVQGGRFRNTAW